MKALEILKDREQSLDCKLNERIEKSYNKQYEDDNQITRAILDELNFLDKMIKKLEDLGNSTCNWYQDEEDSSAFSSDCGVQFTFNEGMPSENYMKFCCKCGKN